MGTVVYYHNLETRTFLTAFSQPTSSYFNAYSDSSMIQRAITKPKGPVDLREGDMNYLLMTETAEMTLWILVMVSMFAMEATPRPSAEIWKHEAEKGRMRLIDMDRVAI